MSACSLSTLARRTRRRRARPPPSRIKLPARRLGARRREPHPRRTRGSSSSTTGVRPSGYPLSTLPDHQGAAPTTSATRSRLGARRRALDLRARARRLRIGAHPDDLRLTWPVVRHAGFSGHDRLGAGIPVRDIRGMKAIRRSFAPRTAIKDRYCRGFTGATGLEPATGVTVERPTRRFARWSSIVGLCAAFAQLWLPSAAFQNRSSGPDLRRVDPR